jgi:hypothetical protein
VNEATAVANVSGGSPEAYRSFALQIPDATLVDSNTKTFRGPGGRPLYGAGETLVRIAYGAVRLCSPQTVVETGVAQGVTTRTILSALEANGRGHLYSVDLPVLFVSEEEFVGRLVPESVRRRWTLTLGPSRKVLPALVQNIAPIDIFLHDADHSYQAQLEEYRTVWPHIKPGGLLISDDVGNPAFVEFAAHAGASPFLVGDPYARSAVGLLRKPE